MLNLKSRISPETLAIFLVVTGVLFFFLVLPISLVLVKSIYVGGKVTFEFFRLMFQNPTISESIINSLELAACVTLFTTFLAFPLAHIMQKYEFRLKILFSGLVLVPMVMPPFVGAIGMARIFSQYGALNLLLIKLHLLDPLYPIDWFSSGGFWGVVLLEVLALYPIMYLNVMAAMANVDPSLEEAATVFGANRFRSFSGITVPLVLPGFFAGAIIVFIWALTDLGTPLMFGFDKVIPVQIFNMVQDINENPMGFVLVVLVVVITITAFLVSKTVIGRRRYEMLSRGHTSSDIEQPGWIKTLGIYSFLVALVSLALIPHFSVFLTSIADHWSMSVLPDSYTTRFFSYVFSDPISFSGLRISLLLATASTFCDILLGVGVAYLLTRTRFPGRDLLDSLVMLPLGLPGVVVAFGYVATFSGSIFDPRENPIPLLIIAYSIRRLPYMVRSAYAGFQQTSVSLEEAAQSLGASAMHALRTVTIPLVFANLVAGALMCFAYAMLEVSDSLILAMKEDFYPLTKAIYALFGRVGDGEFVASALGMISMLILTACILIASRLLGKRMGELFRSA